MSIDTIAGRPVHPALALFPLGEDDEQATLTADIEAHGQLEPIVVHAGQVLDGRRRLLACEALGIEPVVRPWECQHGTPVAYILARNLHRRHLTPAERAFIAAELMPAIVAEAKERQRAQGGDRRSEAARSLRAVPAQSDPGGRSRDRAAKLTGASPKAIARAVRIERAAPELVAAVKDGEMSMSRADAVAREREAKDSPIVARVKRAAAKRRAKAATGDDQVGAYWTRLRRVVEVEVDRAPAPIRPALLERLDEWTHGERAKRSAA